MRAVHIHIHVQSYGLSKTANSGAKHAISVQHAFASNPMPLLNALTNAASRGVTPSNLQIYQSTVVPASQPVIVFRHSGLAVSRCNSKGAQSTITCYHALRGVAHDGSFVLPELQVGESFDHGREDLPHRSGNLATCDAMLQQQQGAPLVASSSFSVDTDATLVDAPRQTQSSLLITSLTPQSVETLAGRVCLPVRRVNLII